MTPRTRFWQLAPDLYFSAPDATLLSRTIDLVFSRMAVGAPPAAARCVSLDLQPAADSKLLFLVDSMPIVHAESERHLPPVIESSLDACAVRARTDCAVFHAGCVQAGGKTVLLLGEKSSGKSTLALWLATHGARYLGDELIFVHPADGRIEGFPKAVSLKEKSFTLFGEAETYVDPARGALRYIQPPDCTPPFSPSARPDAIIVPRFGPFDQLRVTDLAPHETALMLIQQSFGGLDRDPQTLDLIAALATTPAKLMEYPAAEAAGSDILRTCGVATP
ncbi:MAG: hypothetical protein BWK77_06900 [Verrucomicrobia bacterium A1]|nr:MAG: hypothetical protein BWK77_06900 [Verrucomicrobia bacterium A1]